MKQFILTGMPGAGKTAILRQLERNGFSVVEEAATDVIALESARGNPAPHERAGFIDAIVSLQAERRARAARLDDAVQFHDRSAICTHALASFLGYPVSEALARELALIETEAIYQRRVFFIRHLGFVTATDARRISFEDALQFEAVHEASYRAFGYEIVYIATGPVADRAAAIAAAARWG